MLDVPNFFWDSEPTLHPLYVGVREYLEIKPRIQVLNERCRVFLDLAEILSDSIADNKMSSKPGPFHFTLSCHTQPRADHFRSYVHYHRLNYHLDFGNLLRGVPAIRHALHPWSWVWSEVGSSATLRRAKLHILRARVPGVIELVVSYCPKSRSREGADALLSNCKWKQWYR